MPKNEPVASEFLLALRDTGIETLTRYLQANNAPEQVIRTLESIMMIDYMVFESESQDTFDDCPQMIVKLVNDIAAMGGVFHSGYGVLLERNPRKPLKWPLPTATTIDTD